MKYPDYNQIIKVIEENSNSSVNEIVSIREFNECIHGWDITYTDNRGRMRGFCMTNEMLDDDSQTIVKEIKRDAEILKKKARTAENALHSLALKATGFTFDHTTKELIIFTDDGIVKI